MEEIDGFPMILKRVHKNKNTYIHMHTNIQFALIPLTGTHRTINMIAVAQFKSAIAFEDS